MCKLCSNYCLHLCTIYPLAPLKKKFKFICPWVCKTFSSFCGGSAEPRRLDQGAGCHGLLSHLILLKSLPPELRGHSWIRACSTADVPRPGRVSQSQSGWGRLSSSTDKGWAIVLICSKIRYGKVLLSKANSSSTKWVFAWLHPPRQGMNSEGLCSEPISGFQNGWVMWHYCCVEVCWQLWEKAIGWRLFLSRNKQTNKQSNKQTHLSTELA